MLRSGVWLAGSIFRAPTLLSQPLESPPETLLSQLAPLIWRKGVRSAQGLGAEAHLTARK